MHSGAERNGGTASTSASYMSARELGLARDIGGSGSSSSSTAFTARPSATGATASFSVTTSLRDPNKAFTLTSNNRNKQMAPGAYAASGYGTTNGQMKDPHDGVAGPVIMQRDV